MYSGYKRDTFCQLKRRLAHSQTITQTVACCFYPFAPRNEWSSSRHKWDEIPPLCRRYKDMIYAKISIRAIINQTTNVCLAIVNYWTNVVFLAIIKYCITYSFRTKVDYEDQNNLLSPIVQNRENMLLPLLDDIWGSLVTNHHSKDPMFSEINYNCTCSNKDKPVLVSLC